MEIKNTKNYSTFKFDTNKNRTINYTHLTRLKEAIKEKNLLADNPIVVDTNHVVIDGQHRLMAAQQLGVDVYYFVASTMTLSDTAKINGSSRKWAMDDYMDLYVKNGVPSYLWMKSMKAKFPFLSITKIMELGNYGDLYVSKARFYAGTYDANDIEFAGTVAEYVNDYSKFTKDYRRDSFIGAIEYLVGSGIYDHSRIMQKMKYAASKLRPQICINGYVKNLEEIANYQTTEKTRVDFPEKRPGSKYRVDKKLVKK